MPLTKQDEAPQIKIENARLLFRNFTGLEKAFNAEGERNFSVILPEDLAKKMIAQGWRVKQLKPREDGEEGDYHIKVKVNYKTGRPPRCVLISSQNKNDLGEDEITIFDQIDIKVADLIINGYWSDMAGGGYGAYLKTIFVTINEDELEQKYDEEHQEPGAA